ncbi:MAG TPA: N-acetyltransferase [Steroidobacteraceae bacterium]
MEVRVRRESAADASLIKAVTRQAFLTATHTSHTEHLIVDALRQAGALAVSLVAEAGGTVIGHVGVSPVAISDGTAGWFGLGPISVLPRQQRRGVGSKLMHAALGLLRDRNAAGCVVLGEPAFYSRFGLQPYPDLVLAGAPPEYFQAICFDARHPRGTVTYHAAFAVREPPEGRG